MNAVAIHGSSSGTARLIVLFCLFWPLLSLVIIPRRGRSSVPLTAMLIPVSVAACGTWLGHLRALEGMARFGGGRASCAAGVAEALALLFGGLCTAGFVAVAALIRRHRPVADGVAILLTALVVADCLALMILAPHRLVAWAGAWTSLLIALASLIWLIVARQRPAPPEASWLVPVTIGLSLVFLGFFTWQRIEAFARIARFG